ncbi:aldehyde dehydrogenase family protein [Georgenia wutianyii]|uniref:Aldehyde dehydrogenase family protein n=1 Tax=Georgenia wutianyii TaxID=2585135 RepID=A0ABX5VIC4_9MICO|nr:aldehyde dehydrogenase family protein [Georgenia wutianyii]QDB78057.1 aldehyde dehydrogenase family protein [Georgenia wutianyii]
MTTVLTTDPRTGRTVPTHLEESTPADVHAAVAAAVDDTSVLRRAGRDGRAALLDLLEARVLEAKDALVETAAGETGLPTSRLSGEVDRAAHQFGLFADVLRDGGYLEVMVDHADGPLPEVRRMLVPVGPVVVFGASNFPFAFSVLGGDTASALGAGCGVVAKAHPAHPLTSALSARIVTEAAQEVLGADGLHLLHGFQAGLDAVRHPAARAVTLTGSVAAARGILDVIAEREEPIPFFGELSSLNPLVVLPGAADSRADDIAHGLFTSFTGSGGQLCTKPGFAFVPDTEAGDRLVRGLREMVGQAPATVLLSSTIRESFTDGVEAQVAAGAVRVASSRPDPAGIGVAAELLETDAERLDPQDAHECFGPLLTVVRYRATGEVVRALRDMARSLTVSIHADDVDRDAVAEVLAVATERAGRIVFDGYPTGVRVSWAQHHGGPWPSTNSQHTSVGATAIRRFLRPVAFQNAPEWVLPAEMRDDSEVPRRVDGVLRS